MATPAHRGSSLPTIRCSNCGDEIELGSMTDHVCVRQRSHDGLLYQVQDHQRFAPPALVQSTATQPVQMGSGITQQIPDASRLRPRRPPALPRIDPYASSTCLGPGSDQADRSGMYPGELTPTSSGHGSQMVSPKSASSEHKSPWRAAPRKLTTPAIRRPPSPELTNLDCPFPPFPVARTRSNTPVSDTKSQSSDTEIDHARRRARSKSKSATASPQVSKPVSRAASISSTKSRKRSGTTGTKDGKSHDAAAPPSITSNPRRRPSLGGLFKQRKSNAAEVPPLPTTVPSIPTSRKGSVDDAPASAVKPDAVSSATQLYPRGVAPISVTPVLVSSPPSVESDPHQDRQPVDRKASESIPTLAPAFDFQLQAPVQDPFSEIEHQDLDDNESIDQIPSIPTMSSDSNIVKEPSYRAKRPGPILSSGSTYSVRDSMQSPPRSSTSPSSAARGEVVDNPSAVTMRRPSEPAPIRWDQRPPFPEGLHGLSIIMASPSAIPVTAGHPALSPTSLQRLRLDLTKDDGEDDDNWNQLQPPLTETAVAEPEQNEGFTNELRPRSDSASSYGSTISMALSASSRSSPPPGDELNRLTTTTLAIPLSSELPLPLRPRMQPDSPTDPLLQAYGHFATIPPLPVPVRAPEPHRRQTSSDIPDSLTSLAARPLPSRSRTVPANKGTCRGCAQIIDATQKSVSSADGRLTGRYHKGCFVCRTCRAPFATADFYVHNDNPYCAPHYHELNGTLCGSCGKGIEGQYLETSTSSSSSSPLLSSFSLSSSPKQARNTRKFHPHCLKCATCHCQLYDDYFEFNSRVYCERDASRLASLPTRSQYDSAPARPSPLGQGMLSLAESAAAAGSKGRFPERRTTKLMML